MAVQVLGVACRENILYFLPWDHVSTERATQQTSGNDQHERLVVGWFSFTCCEDSTILLTELLNDHLDEWKKVVEFRHMKALKTKNSLAELDVAFIEGAISSESQANEVRQIRENAKYVVAIGACACTGKPSTSRNQFVSEQINERIRWYLSHFDYGQEVKRLDEVPGSAFSWMSLRSIPFSGDMIIEIPTVRGCQKCQKPLHPPFSTFGTLVR